MRATNRLGPVLAGLCCLAATAPVLGETIAVDDADIARLGIVVSRPTLVSEVEMASLPAEVVIPPAQQAAVTAPVAGLVTRLFAAEGEPVTAGQAVAEIQSPDYMRIQREFLEALADDELAAGQLERDEGLLAEGIIATRRMQETTAAARAARLARDQARQQLAIAGLDAAAVDRLIATRQLAPALVMRAPFDGFVIDQQVTVGDSIDAFEPVIRVADLSQLWIEAHAPQELARRVAPGMRMVLDAGAARREATVTTVGRTVDADTQTVLVRGVLNAAGDLNAGQFLTVTIVSADSASPAFAVPVAAVTRVGDGTQLFVRNADGFRMTAVDVLSENGEVAFVVAAIDASTPIAVDGVSALKSLLSAGQEEE